MAVAHGNRIRNRPFSLTPRRRTSCNTLYRSGQDQILPRTHHIPRSDNLREPLAARLGPSGAVPFPRHQQRENISEWRARHRQGGLGQVPAALSIVNNRGRGSPARSLAACSRGVVWPKRTRQNNSSISARRIAALLKACAARDSVCAQGFACAASRAAARARPRGSFYEAVGLQSGIKGFGADWPTRGDMQ